MVYLAVAPARGQQEQSRRGPRMMRESWNWPEDSNVRVFGYSNCQTVELFVNDKLVGEKSLSDFPDRRMNWEAAYEPGVLKAVGKNDGKAVCQYVLRTAGPAKKIALKLDAASTYPGVKNTFQFEVSVVDEEGNLIAGADNEIQLKIEGPARLLGFGNGDNACHDNETDATHRVYQGRALAVVQSSGQPGKITIQAVSSSLAEASLLVE